MKILRDTVMVKSLLLLMLRLALPKVLNIAPPKPENCPSLDKNSVMIDVHILNQNVGSPSLRNIHNRSSSPWDYNITWDSNRFPSEIVQARCRYSGCINAQGQEDNSMNSIAIQQEVLVLRRDTQSVPHGCTPAFRLEKMLVTVGCTCVTPIVVQHVG
ncbi:interleukin-17F [Cynocephalus volans]|uniref:interleukin-17F n=1 Tax=Cynocephalus volans TaxID=110931 RepID=UPI002FC6C5B2